MKRVSRPVRIALSETSTKPDGERQRRRLEQHAADPAIPCLAESWTSAIVPGLSSERVRVERRGRRPQRDPGHAEQRAAHERQVERPAGELGPPRARGGRQERHRVGEPDEADRA